MENNVSLEQLWDAARHQAPVLSAEELISQLPMQVNASNAAKASILKVITALVFTTIMIIGIYWFNPKEKFEASQEDLKLVSSQVPIKPKTNANGLLIHKEHRQNPINNYVVNTHGDTLSEVPIMGSTTLELTLTQSKIDSPIEELVEGPLAFNFGLIQKAKPNINLTEEQLQKLGIIYDEKTLTYCTQAVYDRDQFKLMAEPPKFYMEIKRGGNTYMLVNNIGSRKKLPPYPAPIMVERRIINQEKPKKKYYQTDSLEVYFLKGNFVNKDISHILLNFCRGNLAVISLPVITKPLPPYGKTDYEVNFYYSITDTFLRCLPPAAINELQPFINSHPPKMVNQLLSELIEQESIRKEGQTTEELLIEQAELRDETSANALARLKPLIATKAFLDSMEIKVTSEGISVKHCEEGFSCFTSLYNKEGSSTDFVLLAPGQVKPTKVNNTVPSPLLITNPDGKGWRTIAMDTKQPKDSMDRLLANLIPVLVKSGQSYTAGEQKRGLLHPDILLWYQQTPAFNQKLPPGFLSAANCSYKEECVSKINLLKELKVYPNPLEEEIHIEFILEKANPVEIKLIALGGQEIANFGIQKTVLAGANNLTLKSPVLAPGIYILLLQTPSGDLQMKKLIKR